MTNDVKRLTELKDELMQYHEDLYLFITETLCKIRANKYTPEELCDISFLCRRMELYFDELKKTVKARKELCVKLMGFFLATQSLENPEECVDRIFGTLASARVSLKTIPAIPKKDDPSYKEFMMSLGLPENLLGGGLLKPDFKGITKLVTDMVSEGKNLPPGVEKTWTNYTANFYEKRNKEK